MIGRKLPSKEEPEPPLYKLQIFAPNKVVAKSRFWYFVKRLKKVKSSAGDIVSIKEVFEKKPSTVKNYGIWIRYDSRSGTHNMYKEYRECSRTDAIASCYQDMASRHRARFSSIHIIRIEEVKAADLRRPYIKQLIDSKLKFPVPHSTNRSFRPIFAGCRPSTAA